MADIVEADPREAFKIAIIIAVVALVVNGLFWWLSGAYFADRAQVYGSVGADEIQSTRLAFAVFTVVTAGAAALAVRFPRLVGHSLPLVAALAALVGAIAAKLKGMHIVMPATLFVFALLLPLLTWKSLEHRRAGWAFLSGMCAMLAVITLFGATKVRTVLGISLWHAMIIPGLFAVATAALSMIRTQYRES